MKSIVTFQPGLLPSTARLGRPRLASPDISYCPPSHIDRRPELLTSSNQGQSSQCLSYALAGWIEFYNWKYKGVMKQVDPGPIYARAKEIDEYPNQLGTSLEAGLQAAQDLGLMLAVDQLSIRQVSSEDAVKQALHQHGVVLGAFTATDQWAYASADGWMKPGGRPLGGHAVLLCGYSDVEDPPWRSLQNSWGKDLGWRGFVRMSPEQFAEEFDYGLVWSV